jgi:hypothetical protein
MGLVGTNFIGELAGGAIFDSPNGKAIFLSLSEIANDKIGHSAGISDAVKIVA